MVDFQGSTKIEQKKEKPNIIDESVNYLKSGHFPCALNLDEERLRDILENIPSAVIVVEKPDVKVTYANKRAAELVGVNPCGYELNKNPLSFKILTLEGKICPTEELYAYRALFKEESFRNSTAIVEQPNGKRFSVVVSAKPLYDKAGKVNSAAVIFEDVTAHVKTQNSLPESKERLRMAQKIAHVGSWEYNVKDDTAIWSEELFDIFGLRPQKFGPNLKEYVARIHLDDREIMNKAMEPMIFKGDLSTKISFDYRIVSEDGSIRTIHSERLVREVGDDKKPTRIVA